MHKPGPLTSDFFLQQPAPRSADRWVIGFSGGLDSSVLLHLCAAYRDQHQPNLQLAAVHVHHGLASEADAWLNHCQQVCEQNRISLQSCRVQIAAESRRSIEQLARRARYACFREYSGPDDLLLLAHHQDDQAETLLYRLMRGSGVLGLRGMDVYTEERGLQIWRPLLSVSRNTLESHARQLGLSWVEDPSNKDTRYDRNFIRQELVPLLFRRWPSARQTLSRTARLAAESAHLNDVLASLDLAPALLEPVPGSLLIAGLQSLDSPRLNNSLRYWLRQQGASLPSEQLLLQVAEAVRGYHPEQNTRIDWGQAGGEGRWELRTFQQRLWLLRASEPVPDHWQATLVPEQLLELPAGLGLLQLHSPAEGNTSVERTHGQKVEAVRLSPDRLTQPLRVRFRQGGERFQPAGRPAKPLKKWLHEWQVPPWERDRLPLLFCGEQLLWVPGYGVAQGREAPAEDTGSLLLEWRCPENRPD